MEQNVYSQQDYFEMCRKCNVELKGGTPTTINKLWYDTLCFLDGMQLDGLLNEHIVGRHINENTGERFTYLYENRKDAYTKDICHKFITELMCETCNAYFKRAFTEDKRVWYDTLCLNSDTIYRYYGNQYESKREVEHIIHRNKKEQIEHDKCRAFIAKYNSIVVNKVRQEDSIIMEYNKSVHEGRIAKKAYSDSVYQSSINQRETDIEIHQPNGELIKGTGMVYKVKMVKWLDSGNGVINKAEVDVLLTINETNDTLITNIPILNGRFHTKFKVIHSATYDFTGIPAMIYGTKAIDMDLLDIMNMERIRIMISDKLMILPQ